ncbi:MAG: ribbon-helix-helix domain-containing protein [Alphaproteobacteria bacterium]
MDEPDDPSEERDMRAIRPDRAGMAVVSARVPYAMDDRFQRLAVKEKIEHRALLAEAINDLFEKYGKPAVPIAFDSAGRKSMRALGFTDTIGGAPPGPKILGARLPEAVKVRFGGLAIELHRTSQALFNEALNDLFVKRGLPAVDVNYTAEELTRRTEAFLAPDGPWEKFAAAEHALQQRMLDVTQNEGLVSHRPGLSPEEAKNVAIGHLGLGGEFGNGLGTAVVTVMMSSHIHSPLLERVAKAAQSYWGKPSQLSGFDAGLAGKMGIPKETCGEALFRCADEIDQWKTANRAAGVLDDREAQQVDRCLGKYRIALKPVHEYMVYAQGLLGQLAVEATPSR